MANYWSIAIGINQYQSFQPLMYAQRDAQVFREFLIKEAQFSPQQCFLLTDASAKNGRIETLPSRENILACIARTCQQRLQPGDFLWCFFSGYGVRFQGKDYLVPIEAKPDQIATAGIPIELLFSLFETAPTSNILLVLDVNRSQSVLAGEGVGDQTVLLAKEHGIATLLSCPPNQLSHETLALRQGLFTAAMLEGMRQGCVTLEQLAQYLTYRLPELSEHHWRPRQEPVIEIPTEKHHQLIVPEEAAVSLGASLTIPAEILRPTPPSYFPARNGSSSNRDLIPPESFWAPTYPKTTGYPATFAPSDRGIAAFVPTGTPPVPPVQPPLTESIETEERADSDSQFWRQLLTWSSIIAVALLAGVFLRNLSQPQEDAPAPAGSSPQAQEAPSQQAALLGELTRQPAPTSPSTSPSASTSRQPIQAERGSDLESAYIAVRTRKFAEAKEFLNRIPEEERQGDYNQVLEQANRGLLSDAKVLLTRTRRLTTENQASDFVDAIGIARKIRANEPSYQEAQQYIERWSHVLLDMAQGRADRPNGSSTSIAADNYLTAIKTAQLIPQDSTAVYKQAQEAVAHWSQKIFDLAQARAAEAKYDVAVQTAEVIPADAPIYDQVQAAIDEWEDKPTFVVAPTP